MFLRIGSELYKSIFYPMDLPDNKHKLPQRIFSSALLLEDFILLGLENSQRIRARFPFLPIQCLMLPVRQDVDTISETDLCVCFLKCNWTGNLPAFSFGTIPCTGSWLRRWESQPAQHVPFLLTDLSLFNNWHVWCPAALWY